MNKVLIDVITVSEPVGAILQRSIGTSNKEWEKGKVEKRSQSVLFG